MTSNRVQDEFFGPIRPRLEKKPKLRVNDIVRIDGKLCRVIRVNDCAAVVLIKRSPREFKTRFDKHVRFQPSAVTVRISVNSEIEILNRNANGKGKDRTAAPPKDSSI